MKWSTFKNLIALTCITTMLSGSFAPIQGKGKAPKNLSPISPLVAAPVAGKISLAGLLPFKERVAPLPSVSEMVEEEVKLNQEIKWEDLNLDSIELKQIEGNNFKIKTDKKELESVRYGSFLMFKQFNLSDTGKFVMEAFDLETKKIVPLKNLGKLLVSMEPIEFEAGSLFRAWDFVTQQEVAVLQPKNPESGISSNFMILKDPIGKDEFGNSLFRAVNRKSGDEMELIETNDFLIEKTELRAGLFQTQAWNKREKQEVTLTRFVTPVKGKLKEFLVLKTLGQGGMGKVEKAWDLQEQKYVAIKQLLKKAEENKEMVARFEREGKLMEQLHHRNITPVTAVGTFPNHFYVMDFIEGKPLDEILKKQHLNLAQAVEITTQVATGLNYVHNFQLNGEKLGIVHRDIKPQNLFLTHEGDVLILDFGISHVSNNTQLTKTGSIMGTPHYMSPEQVNPLGDQQVDHRTDIYAMGIMLYVLVVGKSPFPSTKRITRLLEIKTVDQAHEKYLHSGMLKEELKKDSETLKQIEKIILKATAFDPDDRYQTTEEMLQDLEQLKQEHTVLGLKKEATHEKAITAELVTINEPRRLSTQSFRKKTTRSNFDIHRDPYSETVLEEHVPSLNLPSTLKYFEAAL